MMAAYLDSSMISPFASIGDAVIPNILGRLEGGSFK